MSAQPTEGGLRRWRRGMAARLFLDEPPRTALRETPPPSPAEPPRTPLCPAGHLPLKGGDRPGAGALRCGGREQPPAGVSDRRPAEQGEQPDMTAEHAARLLDCGAADGLPSGRPTLQSPPLRGRCRRSRQRGVFGGGGGGWQRDFSSTNPRGPPCANATAIPSRAAAHPPLSCRTSPPQGGRSTWGGRLAMRRSREKRLGVAGRVGRGDRRGAVAWMRRAGSSGLDVASGQPACSGMLRLRGGGWAAERPRHPPISPLEGEMSAQPTEGGLRWWRRGMAARLFLDEPPRTALRKRHRHPQPSRRAPPSVLPDISPSRGEIDLGRAPCDAAEQGEPPRAFGMRRGRERGDRPGAGALRCGGAGRTASGVRHAAG